MRRATPSLLLLVALACSFPHYTASDGPVVSCGNGIRDGGETGVDCGGDCEACQPCNDGRQDGDETGVDCGGSCVACPTCDDRQRNGGESDIDCGGLCPQRCDTDARCLEPADCASLVCASVCQPATCVDGVRNGVESGTDCGGACVGCQTGQPCHDPSDCATGLCQEMVCVSPDCGNGVRDHEETDEDCGGPDCAPCAEPGACLLDRDCVTNNCDDSRVCASASCFDGKQDQAETALDCGGPECAACANGLGCTDASDCTSGRCQNGTCVSTCAGYALSFDGASYVKIDRPVQDDFTIEAWLKTTAVAVDGDQYWRGAGLFWADVFGGGNDFGATILGTHLAFGTGRTDNASVNLIGKAVINSGNWTHVAVTRQKSVERLQIYINGALDRSLDDASQTNSLNSSTALQIGGNANDKRYYQGLIDEVRVWNVVRSAADLSENKNRRLAGNEAGLVGYWRFDDGAGLLATDSGPAKNHGVLQGPPQWQLSDAPVCPKQ